MTLLLLITAAAGAWADDTNPTVTIDNTKTQPTAWFTMPASDVTVNYTLVRDMNDTENPVAFTGLPTTTTAPIIVKKGDDGKYQPIETLTIQLNDALISGDDKNIIAADGITVTVEKKGDGDTWTSGTLADFQADMQPGTYRLTATPKDETSLYDGTVTTSEFTVVEQYDLTVKPANDFSKGKIENVTVGTEQPITPDANGEATKTRIAPNTDVKIKAIHGYIIEKVETKKPLTYPIALSEVTADYLGCVVTTDGNVYATASDATTAGKDAAAMIAYVSETGHGLAIALSDENNKAYGNDAPSSAAAHTPTVTGKTWKLPSQDEWNNMFKAFGGNEGSYTGLNNALATAGGDSSKLQEGENGYYWRSSSSGSYYYYVSLDGGTVDTGSADNSFAVLVRACFAF